MDVGVVRKELLLALRGRSTQSSFSRKLGYSYNQIYRWEAGKTRISWKDFVTLCRKCKIDVELALKKTCLFPESPDQADRLLQYLLITDKTSVACKWMGVSRFVLGDWLGGRSVPSLDAMLFLFEKKDFLAEFVSHLVSIDKIPSLNEVEKLRAARIEFLNANPIGSLISLCFELADYQQADCHEVGFVAKKLGITQREEEEVIKRLLDLQVIGLERGKYYLREKSNYLRTDPNFDIRLQSFFLEQSLRRLNGKHTILPDERFRYRVFSVSPETYQQILHTQHEFIEKVTQLVMADSHPQSQIKVLTLNLFDLEGLLATK